MPVVNIKTGVKYDVYVGRPSKWGNPFRPKNHTLEERDRVCDQYEKWFWTQPLLVNSIHELRGKVLGCYCKPLRCHADFLDRVANSGEMMRKSIMLQTNDSLLEATLAFNGHQRIINVVKGAGWIPEMGMISLLLEAVTLVHEGNDIFVEGSDVTKEVYQNLINKLHSTSKKTNVPLYINMAREVKEVSTKKNIRVFFKG